jgi:DNA-binding SARP family transcriptional activator
VQRQTTDEPPRFRDLGPLQVVHAGSVQPVRGERLEAALGLLLIHAGAPVGAEALGEAMWGEEGVERSARTVDSHVWRLRRLLEPDRVAGAPPTVLVREPGGYRLVADANRIDSARFAMLATEAAEQLAAGGADRALRCAEEAAALWRGRPYGTAADTPWARAAVARLLEIRGRLRETHVGALLGTGAVDRALVDLESALDEEPLREQLWAYRIAAYRDSGRRSEALATYAKARRVLIDELGIEPGPQLRALHAALLRDDTPEDTPSAPTPRVPEQRRSSRRTPTASRGRLVGRDRALAELLDVLGAGSLVTLTGAAGCGKTRLALEAADRVASRFPDGVCFVDLTSAAPERVPDAVSSAVELPIAGSDDPADALRRFVASRRMLVVLDNCEHVLDAAAELVDAVFVGATDRPTGGSGSAVLTTSREPLEVDGEHVQRLAPLPVDAAVELFLERLDEPASDETVVAEIAAAVDGLPLALELAAGRARVYSLAEIAAQVRADASTLSRIGRGSLPGPRRCS